MTPQRGHETSNSTHNIFYPERKVQACLAHVTALLCRTALAPMEPLKALLFFLATSIKIDRNMANDWAIFYLSTPCKGRLNGFAFIHFAYLDLHSASTILHCRAAPSPPIVLYWLTAGDLEDTPVFQS